MKELKEKILIVDDEPQLCEILASFIRTLDLEVECVSNASDALVKLREGAFFLVITDYQMPGMNGLDLAKAIRETHPLLPLYLMTGHGDRDIVIGSLRSGVNDFIDKPINFELLGRKIEDLAKARIAEIARDLQELEDLKRVFVEESKSILTDLDPLLTDLDDGTVKIEDLNVIYRKVHTLKGSAGSVPGASSLVRLAHSFETLLSALKEGRISLYPDMLTAMLSSLELLGDCVRAIDKGLELPDTQNLQAVLDGIAVGRSTQPLVKSEPSISSTSVKSPSDSPKKVADTTEDGVFVANDRLETLKNVAGELVAFKNSFDVFLKQHGEDMGVHIRELMEMDRTLFKITDQIQQQVSDVQQVSFGKTFAKFPRVVRQVAGELGKQIKLTVLGAEMTVDRTVSRTLSDALIHAVRNSCDHGVENPSRRSAAGKSTIGNITIRGAQNADTITVEIQDDGAGLSRERIVKKAIERGIMTEESAKLASDGEVWDLLFMPNFSTAEKVSDISGRGVGMDVVKTAAKKLGGNAWFSTVAGKETTLTLQFPIPKSLVVESSVVAKSGQMMFIVPLSSISEIRHVDAEEMTFVSSYWTFQNRGVTVPVGHYQFMLDDTSLPRKDREAASVKRSGLVAVLHYRGKSVGVYLDTIVDQLEAVIRPFDDVIGRISGFRGVSRLPNDGVAYVLSAEDAVKNVLETLKSA